MTTDVKILLLLSFSIARILRCDRKHVFRIQTDFSKFSASQVICDVLTKKN